MSEVAAIAATLVDIDGAAVSHIVVERSTFQPTLAAVVRIFVTEARGSGFVELAPDGEVLGVH